MRIASRTLAIAVFTAGRILAAQQITTDGHPARLDVRAAGDRSVRISLRPVAIGDSAFATPALADRSYAAAAISVRSLTKPVTATVAGLKVEVRPNPLTVSVATSAGRLIQQLVFENDGSLSFRLDEQPVL